jgi:hypothetical protein
MKENLRVFFSILWLIGVGASLATGLAVLATWGSYVDYFLGSLVLLAGATAATIATSA